MSCANRGWVILAQALRIGRLHSHTSPYDAGGVQRYTPTRPHLRPARANLPNLE